MENERTKEIFARRVLDALRGIRFRIWRFYLARGLLFSLCLALSVCLGLIALESLLFIPAIWRIAVLAVAATALAALLAAWVSAPLVCYGTLSRTAAAVDRRFPDLKDRLSSAVELYEDLEHRGGLYSEDLVEAALAQAAGLVTRPGAVRGLGDGVLEPGGKLFRLAGYLAFFLVSALLVVGISDPLGTSQVLQSYRHPLAALQKQRNFRIFVLPGNVTLLRGDSLRVKATFSIFRPGDLAIHWKEAGKGPEYSVMSRIPEQFEFDFTFRNLQNELTYYLQQRETVTDTFLVRVTNNPFVTELRLRYEYPSYTRLPSFETSLDKSIQGLRGTRVILTGKASNPLERAKMVLDGDSLRQMSVFDERNFSDTLVLVHDGSYSLRLEDRWGLENTDTLVYPVTVVRDEYPRISLRYPEDGAQLNEQMEQALLFELSDDFGVSRVRLGFRKDSRQDQEQAWTFRTIAGYPAPQPYGVGRYLWDLKELDLLPRDEVVYRLEALDNDLVSGPKSASTPEFRIRFPSLQEIFEQQEKQQDQMVQKLEELEKQGQQVHDQVKQMADDLERGKKIDWDQQRRLDQAIKQQQGMTEQVRELSGRLEKTVQELRRSEMLTQEVLEKLGQVQRLMAEVATEEMKNLLDTIQKAMENLDQKTAADALEKFRLSQEKFLEKLDQTLSMLERLKLEQQMDFLVKRSGEVAQEALALQDSTGRYLRGPEPQAGQERAVPDTSAAIPGPKGKELSSREKSAVPPKEQGRGPVPGLSDRARELEETGGQLFEQIQETSGLMQQAGEEKLAAQLEQEAGPEKRIALQENLLQAASRLDQDQLEKALDLESQAAQQMSSLHGRIKEYRSQMGQKWQAQTARTLERAFDDLSFLSENQEELNAKLALEADLNHPDIVRYADLQQEIAQGLDRVNEALLLESKSNFFVSPLLLMNMFLALETSRASLEEFKLEVRRENVLKQNLGNALALINAAMISLIGDQEGLKNSSSGVGYDQLMARLKDLANRQEALNQRTEGAYSESGQQSPGQRTPGLSGQIGEMLARMAAEQRAIREQMEELAQQMAGRKDMFGSSLEGMIQEADKVLEDMLGRGVSPETLERQRRILDRLLDAQRSIQQRDSSRERKSETAREYEIEFPPSLARELLEQDRGRDELQTRLQEWKGAYPESFESLIRAYYELLNSKKMGKTQR